jgi:hypothetical protein
MCYIDGQENKYSVLNERNRMLKYYIGHMNSVVHYAECHMTCNKVGGELL